MIVKKIKTQKYTKPKAWQIADLVDYIRHMKSKNPDEKVTYTGHRGFFSDTHTAQKLEMIALASESIQSKMPVTHWLFSWRENEQPCAKHVEEITDTFLEHMGLKHGNLICKIFWGELLLAPKSSPQTPLKMRLWRHYFAFKRGFMAHVFWRFIDKNVVFLHKARFGSGRGLGGGRPLFGASKRGTPPPKKYTFVK